MIYSEVIDGEFHHHPSLMSNQTKVLVSREGYHCRHACEQRTGGEVGIEGSVLDGEYNCQRKM
jgi:hypothetical protein